MSSKITQRFTAEQHPSEVNHDHGIQMAHKARKAGKLFQKEGVLHVDEQEEIQSPDDQERISEQNTQRPCSHRSYLSSSGTELIRAAYEILLATLYILIYNKSCIIFLRKWHILCFSKEC